MATSFLWAQIFDCRAGDAELKVADAVPAEPIGEIIHKAQFPELSKNAGVELDPAWSQPVGYISPLPGTQGRLDKMNAAIDKVFGDGRGDELRASAREGAREIAAEMLAAARAI
jgi:hypothetical protein